MPVVESEAEPEAGGADSLAGAADLQVGIAEPNFVPDYYAGTSEEEQVGLSMLALRICMLSCLSHEASVGPASVGPA